MWGKIIKGTLLGGLVAWIWLIISWGFLPWHCNVMHTFTNETEVATAITNNSPHNGIYFLPSFCDKTEGEESDESFEKGPIIFAAIQRHGAPLRSVIPYILSLLVHWIGAFFIFLVLLQARHLNYGSKVAMTTLIGVIIGFLGAFPNWVWWGFPLSYVSVQLCDVIIAWFLASLFMAPFAKRKPPHHKLPQGEINSPTKDSRKPWDLS